MPIFILNFDDDDDDDDDDNQVWQWSNDFTNPRHWEAGQPPCPGQAVILPPEIVFMPAAASIGSIHIAAG